MINHQAEQPKRANEQGTTVQIGSLTVYDDGQEHLPSGQYRQPHRQLDRDGLGGIIVFDGQRRSIVSR
jgi:hypothetical protein